MDPEIRYLISEFFDNSRELEDKYVFGTIDRSIYTVYFNSGNYILTKGGCYVYSGNDSGGILKFLRKAITEEGKNGM